MRHFDKITRRMPSRGLPVIIVSAIELTPRAKLNKIWRIEERALRLFLTNT